MSKTSLISSPLGVMILGKSKESKELTFAIETIVDEASDGHPLTSTNKEYEPIFDRVKGIETFALLEVKFSGPLQKYKALWSAIADSSSMSPGHSTGLLLLMRGGGGFSKTFRFKF